MGNERIAVSRDGHVGHVELIREDKRNAMDGGFFEELGDAFAALGADGAVRAVLISARGRHFGAGLDLGWAARHFAPATDAGRAAEKRLRLIRSMQAAVSAVEACRAPVIAAIHGGCIGGAVDLACACDLRVAAADAWFQIAEIDVAITADLGTLQRLPRLIPGGIARELALTGRKFGAEEAVRWGLINALADDRAGAIAAGLALARTIAAKSPMAAAGAKASLNHSRGRPIADGLEQVALWNAATLMNGDLATAMGGKTAFSDLD